MKFPKDLVIINNKLKELLVEEKYFEIIKLRDEILDKADLLDDYAFNTLIKVTFMLGDFNGVIVIFSDLFRKEIENYSLLYYGILAMLANTDIYQAKSFIKQSKLLNQNSLEEYFEKDGANYSKISSHAKIDLEMTLALVLVNFINGLAREVIGDLEIDNEYILFRFFDLINMLYELNYPEEVIQSLTGALKIIFNLEV